MQDLAVQPQPEQDGREVGQPDPHGNDADNSGSHGTFSSKQPEYCPHRIDVSSSRMQRIARPFHIPGGIWRFGRNAPFART